jgi:hypothetical protein
VNFGWALTPQPKSIPIDGSTIQVFVDSVPVGTVNYNNPRSDIQALFPGYANTDGAVGYRFLDTTTLANGVHTIAWQATDNLGASAGIGSRYFNVSNSGVHADSVATPAETSTQAALSGDVDRRTDHDAVAIGVRHGYAANAPTVTATLDANGVNHVHTAPFERVVLDLKTNGDRDARYRGYQIFAGQPRALPIGSHLDAATGEFAWAPPLGFGGTHELIFVRDAAGRTERIRVHVTIDGRPAATGEPQMVIDTPSAGAATVQPFTLAGWTFDPRGPRSDPGVDAVHVWAYPIDAPGQPLWVGAAGYGGMRPDVAALYGWRNLASGFSIDVTGLPSGTYDIVVYARSVATRAFTTARVVRVSVR